MTCDLQLTLREISFQVSPYLFIIFIEKKYNLMGVLGHAKGDFRLFFWFLATQLARVCL